MGKVLSAADHQGHARLCVVLECEYSGSGFIWLSHVIWDIVVEDCSLKQHTPPCTVSLGPTLGCTVMIYICAAFCWLNI